MAITCGFFNSLEGDRKYDARQMGEMFDGLIMDGVFMSIGDALKTTPSSGMTVAVGTGRAWFLHTWTKNDSEYLIEVSAAESVLNRIDTIVLDVDNTEAVRSNTIKLIKGTPASNAKRPNLINTTDHKQIPLADILVPAGATSLANTNITNIVGTSECPYVTGPLSIIQNDDILAAWQEEFDTWFEGVQGALDDDTAGNLYNLIQQKVDKTSVLDAMDEVNLTTEKGLVAGALAVKELNSKRLEPDTLLYNTYKSSTGTISLSESYKNFKYLRIECVSKTSTNAWKDISYTYIPTERIDMGQLSDLMQGITWQNSVCQSGSVNYCVEYRFPSETSINIHNIQVDGWGNAGIWRVYGVGRL